LAKVLVVMRQGQLVSIVCAMALLFGNVVCFNALLGRLHGARLDLTEGRMYTLAPQTRELLQEPEEPLEIFFFYTARDRLHEKLRPLVSPISDILKEFAAASEGRVTARIVEWDTADKATQDRATEHFGVKPLPIQMQTSDEETVRNTFFSIVVAYGDQFQRFDQSDLYRIVPIGSGLDIEARLQNVEYLLAKAIYKVIRGFQSIGAALATNNMSARIELYFSAADSLPEFLKKVPGYAAKVAKKLSDEAMGRLKVESVVVGDKPEDDALKKRLHAEYRLRPIQTDLFSDKGIYSYAVINAGGQFVPVPLVTLGEEMSEFEVREAIEGQLKTLIPGFLMTVGVMTPDASKNPMAQMMGQRPPPPEYADMVARLEGEFDVRKIDLSEGKQIPRQITVLVIVRPESLSDKAIYEIDQFLMRGGRLVVCADAYSFDLERAIQLRDHNTLKKVEWDDFRKFLRHLGADVGESMILDTRSEVVRMARPKGRRGEIEFFDVKFPYFVYVEAPNGFDQTHDIVAKQSFILVQWATPVRAATAQAAADGKEALPGVPEGVTAREIAWTSPESSLSQDITEAQAQERLNYAPPKDAQRQPIALVLTGVFPSYFAGKPIPGTEKPAAPESKGTDSAASRPDDQSRGIRLDRSKETSVVVVGDSDFVSPIVAQAFDVTTGFGQNLAFLRNAIDFGGPEARLMAIRNRENVQRPLLALRGFDEQERQTRTQRSRWLALTVPCGLLVLFGAGWAVVRRNRKPLDLPGPRHATSRVTT
jgi:ABC-2 type transport system permease protein